MREKKGPTEDEEANVGTPHADCDSRDTRPSVPDRSADKNYEHSLAVSRLADFAYTRRTIKNEAAARAT